MGAQDDLGSPVEPRLDVHEGGLVLEHASAEIDELDASPGLVLEQDVFGLDIGVDDAVLPEEDESVEDLDGEGADVGHLDGLELVELHQVVQADAEQLGDDADVASKHDEIFDPDDVLLVVDVPLLGAHQDVDLVKSQLHVLFLRLY